MPAAMPRKDPMVEAMRALASARMTGAPDPDTLTPENIETTMRALAARGLNTPVASEPTPPPVAVDPSVTQRVADDVRGTNTVQSLAGMYTPGSYGVKQGRGFTQIDAPGWDRVRAGLRQPLVDDAARVAKENATQDSLRAFAEAQRAAKGTDIGRATELTAARARGVGAQNALDAKGDLAGDNNASKERIAKVKAAAGGDGGAPLSDKAIEQAAHVFAKDGTLPQLSRGAAGMASKVKIMNRAQELYPDTDLTGLRGETKASKSSLAALQKNTDAVNAFEETANKNLKLLLDAAKKIGDLNSPWLNKPGRALARGVGDPNIAAFNAARRVAVAEIGRVLQSANAGGTPVSDSARHEIDSLMSEDATGAQIIQAAKVLAKDMANRRDSYAAQIAEITGRLSKRPSKALDDAAAEAERAMKGE